MTAVTSRENTLAHIKNFNPFDLKMSVERSKLRCLLTLILRYNQSLEYLLIQ